MKNLNNKSLKYNVFWLVVDIIMIILCIVALFLNIGKEEIARNELCGVSIWIGFFLHSIIEDSFKVAKAVEDNKLKVY